MSASVSNLKPDTSSTKKKKKKKRERKFVSNRICLYPFVSKKLHYTSDDFFHCHNKLSTHLDATTTITVVWHSRVVRWPSRHRGLMSLTKSTWLQWLGFKAVPQGGEGFSVITTPNSTRCWDESKECSAPLYDILPSSPLFVPTNAEMDAKMMAVKRVINLTASTMSIKTTRVILENFATWKHIFLIVEILQHRWTNFERLFGRMVDWTKSLTWWIA